MSEVSDIYDALVSTIETTFSSHRRLDNVYDLAGNDELKLVQGWGINTAGGVNLNLQIGCKMSLEDDYEVTFTRQFYALDKVPSDKAETVKLLLEDRDLLVKTFEKDATIDGLTSKMIFKSASPVDLVREGTPFLFVRLVFGATYFRDLTS